MEHHYWSFPLTLLTKKLAFLRYLSTSTAIFFSLFLLGIFLFLFLYVSMVDWELWWDYRIWGIPCLSWECIKQATLFQGNLDYDVLVFRLLFIWTFVCQCVDSHMFLQIENNLGGNLLSCIVWDFFFFPFPFFCLIISSENFWSNSLFWLLDSLIFGVKKIFSSSNLDYSAKQKS